MPDIGIVMPVYKQKKNYLRTAIRSIRNQVYTDYKFIIVIDGITPRVRQVVHQECRRDKRIQVVSYQRNKGVAHALNVGFNILMKNPQIQYLTWIASDNLYYPNFLQELRAHLQSGSHTLGLVYSSMYFMKSNGKLITNNLIRKRERQMQPKEKLLDYNFVLGSFMYKKIYAIKVGNYKHSPVEDYDYWLRITELCDIKYIPKELIAYRLFGPLSNSSKIKRSIALYRKNRYKYQLVKHLARKRRNIQASTTIIFPVRNRSIKTINRLENILEQKYSNFRLLVIDAKQKSIATTILKRIPDPRIHLIRLPYATMKKIKRVALKHVNTPFLLFYGKGKRIRKKAF